MDRALVTKLAAVAAEKIVKKMKAPVPRDEGTWSSQKIKDQLAMKYE